MVNWTNQGALGASTKFGVNAGINAGASQAGATLSAAVSPALAVPTVSGMGGGLSPTTIIIGLALLMFGLKMIGENAKTDINPAHLHIGAYNILSVTVTAIVGIVMLKYIFNRWQVPGLTDIINAA